METIYCTIDAKRLTAAVSAQGRQACGGTDAVCYAFVPSHRRPAGPGTVVDLEAYRAAHGLTEAVRPEPKAEPQPRQDSARSWKLLDLCSSAAVIGASLAVILSFLSL